MLCIYKYSTDNIQHLTKHTYNYIFIFIYIYMYIYIHIYLTVLSNKSSIFQLFLTCIVKQMCDYSKDNYPGNNYPEDNSPRDN